MGWSRSLAHSFSPALRAQCPETGGAWTQAPSAGGRRRSPGEQRGQCPPSSRPSLSPLGGLGGSPGGTGRATCPRPLCPAAMTDSAASFRGPVAEPSPPAVPSSPLRGLLLACAMESCLRNPCPISPTSTSGLERGWAHWWPQRRQCHRGASLFLGWELGTHPSNLPAGVRVGVMRARTNSWCLGSCAQSYACLFVLSPEVCPESQ